MTEYMKASSEATIIAFPPLRTAAIGVQSGSISPDHFRRHACDLAHAGFPVFALIAGGKKPARANWQCAATSCRERTFETWSAPVTGEPLAYNIGIATGRGLFVLDIDNKDGKNGSATLARLELEHGDLPPTMVVRTASGGFHYYFRAPPDLWIPNSAGKLGLGIDVRGDGGYVVAAGSVIAGRTYEQEPQQ